MRGRLVQSDIEIRELNDRNVVVEDLYNVEDDSYSDLRKQLIDNYIYCSDHDLVEWI